MYTNGFETLKLVLDQSQFLTKRLFCISQSATIKSFQESVTNRNKYICSGSVTILDKFFWMSQFVTIKFAEDLLIFLTSNFVLDVTVRNH
jgi:hypothetical protein